jgi:hypothetical protein
MLSAAAINTESAIWSRLLRPAGRTLSVAVARALLLLDFPDEDKERMHKLAAKAREGLLTSHEQEEVANYERVGNLLALMKTKARQSLKRAAKGPVMKGAVRFIKN